MGRVGGGQGSRRGGRGVRTLGSDAGLRESMGVAARERTLVEFFPARMLAIHPCSSLFGGMSRVVRSRLGRRPPQRSTRRQTFPLSMIPSAD